jgi:hypothetical protein
VEREDTSAVRIREFIFDNFGKRVNKSWVSRFLQEHHLSMQTARGAYGYEFDPNVVKTGSEFIQHVRNLMRRRVASQLVAVDKTTFGAATTDPPKQAAPRNRSALPPPQQHLTSSSPFSDSAPRRKTGRRTTPLTLFSTLISNGTVAPAFFVSAHRDAEIALGSRRGRHPYSVDFLPSATPTRGNQGVEDYLDYHFQMNTFQEGDVGPSPHNHFVSHSQSSSTANEPSSIPRLSRVGRISV